MKVLCGGARVDHLDIVLRAQRQEAIQICIRMLRPRAFVASRQQHYQPGHLLPFRLRGDDELIDDRLGHIDKITELGLPDHQVPWIGGAEAVFEAQDRQLRKHRVDENDGPLVFGEIGQGHVLIARVVIAQSGVAMREGSALRILAGEPHRCPLQHEAAQRQHFGAAPVDRRLPSAISSRRAIRPLSLGWMVNPSGSRVAPSPTLRSTSADTLVTADQSAPARDKFFHTPPNTPPAVLVRI